MKKHEMHHEEKHMEKHHDGKMAHKAKVADHKHKKHDKKNKGKK